MAADPKARESYRVWTTDTLRYADLDPNGHVNNGAINTFFEDGRVRFRQEHLQGAAADTLVGFVIARFTVEYYAPLYFPGSVEIGTGISRIGNTSYALRQGLFVTTGCVASAESITVSLDPKTSKPRPLPDEWRTLLATFLVEFGP